MKETSLQKKKRGYIIIEMEMSFGEYIDRLSIQLHKVQKIGIECYPEFIHLIQELLLETPIDNFKEVIKGFRNLYIINGNIWKLESDLRQGKEKKLGLATIGKRAVEIRNYNNTRISEQNRLNKLFGGFLNIKKDHISE